VPGVSLVFVAEKISESGLDALRRDGHDVVDAVGWSRERLLDALGTADVLLVRSGTKVDLELLSRAPKLSIVGRAGVGVDNVDLPEATRRGVLVINSPTGNVVSAVEHTFALLFALLRRVPEAAASLRGGKWDRNRFVGSELYAKTLGIAGLGQVGGRVASRAVAFGAKVLGFDPYLPAERAQELNVRLVSFEEMLCESDIVTLHATATDSARQMMNAEAFALMKPGAILVNVARGSLVDRIALTRALESGRLAGAALDVFDPEPPDPSDPLLAMPNVVATPHLGASTVEAQERVAAQTVDAVREALAGAAYVPAVNLPFRRLADPKGAAAWMDLAERLGRFLQQSSDGLPVRLAVDLWGLPSEVLRPAALAAIKGILAATSAETVNLVNALSAAKDRGLAVSETLHEEAAGYLALLRVAIETNAGSWSADGTIFGRGDPRVVAVDRRPLEFRPRGTVLLVRNRDVPGVVGLVGSILGEAGINIAEASLAREESGARLVLSVDQVPAPDVIARLRALPALSDVRVVGW
jgi:D-3-phosphoglycerate dehydrogenase